MVMTFKESLSGTFGGIIPSNFTFYLLVFGVIIFIILLLAGLILLIWYFKKYNNKCIVFADLGGYIGIKYKDRGRILTVGGNKTDREFRFRKAKRIVPMPTKMIEKRLYFFFEREDGLLINVGLEDLNKTSKELKLSFLPNDMVYTQLSLDKIYKDRYLKTSFFEKYGVMIGFVIFMVLVTVCLIVMFSSFKDLVGEMANTSNAIKEMAVAVNNMKTGVTGV